MGGGGYVLVVTKTEDEFSVYFEIQDSRHFRNVTFRFQYILLHFTMVVLFCFRFFACCVFLLLLVLFLTTYLSIFVHLFLETYYILVSCFDYLLCFSSFIFYPYGGLGWVPNEVEDTVHVKICVPQTAHVKLYIYIYIYMYPTAQALTKPFDG